MAGTDPNVLLAQAREHERKGRIKDAYKTYLRAGAVHDAARMLSENGKPGDAGRLLLGVLKIEPSQAGTLDAKRRKLAYLAATYFAKDPRTAGVAVEIFTVLGETNRAADILEKSGDLMGAERVRASRSSIGHSRPAASLAAVSGVAKSKTTAQRLEQEGKTDAAIKAYMELKLYGEAARVLLATDRPAEAAQMYAEAGMPFEAGNCYLKVGDTGKCLDNLVRVPKVDPRYRSAALLAIKVASRLRLLDFKMEHFLAGFVETRPMGDEEVEAFYALGELYEQHNLLANAREAFAKVSEKTPGYRDVDKKLDLLARYTKDSSAVYDRIKEQEDSFQGDRSRSGPSIRPDNEPGLPDLPEMPELSPPQITGLDLADHVPKGSVPAAASQAAPAPQQAPPADPHGGTVAMYGDGSTEADSGFVPGNTIANRYRLDSELGRGGMAVVFSAFDLELEEEVALKVFLQQVQDPKMKKESLARFKQELKLSRQLSHPNIIRLYDIGFHSGYRYISMELLRGAVLEDLMGEPMNLARGLAYLVQACNGLQAVHDKGVIHRDIKPDNIYITSDEVVKIMDFGIAKNTMGRGLTIQGMTAGTPEYIAPEQISAFSEVTQAADQYSLGIIAYRMFTGEFLFLHEELTPLLMMHLNAVPTPPTKLRPDLPVELEQIILRLLAKKPEQRFKSCKDLASHLQHLRSQLRR